MGVFAEICTHFKSIHNTSANEVELACKQQGINNIQVRDDVATNMHVTKVTGNEHVQQELV